MVLLSLLLHTQVAINYTLKEVQPSTLPCVIPNGTNDDVLLSSGIYLLLSLIDMDPLLLNVVTCRAEIERFSYKCTLRNNT